MGRGWASRGLTVVILSKQIGGLPVEEARWTAVGKPGAGAGTQGTGTARPEEQGAAVEASGFPQWQGNELGPAQEEGKRSQTSPGRVREGRSPHKVLGSVSGLLSDFSWCRHLVALFRGHRLIPSLTLLWLWESLMKTRLASNSLQSRRSSCLHLPKCWDDRCEQPLRGLVRSRRATAH